MIFFNKIFLISLLLSTFSFSNETYESFLKEELLIFGNKSVKLSFDSKEDQILLRRLKKYIVWKNDSLKITKGYETRFSEIREYPSYKVSGILINLCAKDISINQVDENENKKLIIKGSLEFTNVLEIKELSSHTDKLCKKQNKTWIVDISKKPWKLLNER